MPNFATSDDLLDAYRRLDNSARAWLMRQGVSTEAMLMHPGPVGVADIEIHDPGIFDIADFGMRAFLHPIYSGGFGSEIIDVIAWMPSNPYRWWTLEYTGWALGDDQLFAAEFWNEPILLHPTPLAWLAADGIGVVVNDWIMSSPALRSIPCIVTEDAEFGREVQRRLTMPMRSCPEIRVLRAAA